MSMNIALTLCYNFVDVAYLTFTSFNRFVDAYHLLRVIVMHTPTSERSCADNLRFITFRGMSYWSRTSVCLCVCLSVAAVTPLHGPRCNLGNSRRCLLVVRYWADLQSVHGFRCSDNTARTRNVSECLYSLYAYF